MSKVATQDSGKPALKLGVAYEDVSTWYTVDELRLFLRRNGQPVSGKKADLVKRVHQYVSKRKQDSDHSSEEEEEEEEEEPKKDKRKKAEGWESDEESDDDDGAGAADPFDRFLRTKLAHFCDSVAKPTEAHVIDEYERKLQTERGSNVRVPKQLRQLYSFCGSCESSDNLYIHPLINLESGRHARITYPCPFQYTEAWIPIGYYGSDYSTFVLVNVNTKARLFGHVRMVDPSYRAGKPDTFKSVHHFMIEMRNRLY